MQNELQLTAKWLRKIIELKKDCLLMDDAVRALMNDSFSRNLNYRIANEFDLVQYDDGFRIHIMVRKSKQNSNWTITLESITKEKSIHA